jgi:HEPN domain-containing protein
MAEDRALRQQELAQLLLQKAQQDLVLVQTVGSAEAVADELVGFHVQQTIEKAIKAVLTGLGLQYEYTHDLSWLYQQVMDAGVAPPVPPEAVEEMTAFAVQFRYTLFEQQDLDRGQATQLATEFIRWAQVVIDSLA